MDMAQIKVTQKQEAYAQEYVLSGSLSGSYEHAYDCENMKKESIYVEGSRMIKNPIVALRVDQIRRELACRQGITLDEFNDELVVAREMAHAAGDFKELRANAMDRGKLNGMVVDRSEVTGKDGESLCLLDHTLLAAVLTDEAKKQLNFEEV